MNSIRSLLLLGCLAWRVQALPPILPPLAPPINCFDVVNGALSPALTNSYEFTAVASGTIQPSTCGFVTSADTAITVSEGGIPLASSDDLGPVVCPGAPKASAVTVHVVAGHTYTITVAPGAAWQVGDPAPWYLDLHCNGIMESYWESMFNNTGYHYYLFSMLNGVWYYDGVSTCVGKGNYWGICPFHHIHCTGDTTYGWGSDQAFAVLTALAQPDGKYPGYSAGCPSDLTCANTQYTCVNLNCVDLDQLCDGTDDCGDGSDEDYDLTNGLCGDGECASHLHCTASEEYCNDDNECHICVDGGVNQCELLGDSIDGSQCPDCSGLCDIFGCMDPEAINYDSLADCDDDSCEYCFNGTGGPSLHLVTDHPAGLNAGKCGLAPNGDLELSCHTSMKYPVSIISLLSPISGDQPFSTEFDQQGTNPVTTPIYWLHTSGPVCDNSYDGVFAWEDVYMHNDSTVMIRSDFPALVMFTGFIAVDMFEQLDPLRGVNLTRWVRQKLPFRITFDTDVTAISGNVTVYDTWNTFFAIIEQETIVVDTTTNPPKIEADIVLWASVQFPYHLHETGVSVNVPALDNAGLSVTLLEDCSPPPGGACNQKFLIHVDLEDECTFTGTYHVDFEVDCLPSVDSPQCPLNSSIHTAAVDFDIETENVCPTLVLHVIATGSVKSYQTPRIGTQPYMVPEHFAFMVDNWAYYEVTLDSIDGLIVETTITRIDLCFTVACGAPVNLYSNGFKPIPDVQLTVLDYPRVGVPPVSPLPKNSDIHLFLANSVFPVPVDGSLDFYLIIEVDVEYYHTASLLEEGQERDLMMVSSEPLRSSPKMKQLLSGTATTQQATITVDVNGHVTFIQVHPVDSETDNNLDQPGGISSPTAAGSALSPFLFIAFMTTAAAMW